MIKVLPIKKVEDIERIKQKYSDRAIINRNLKDSLQQTAAQLHTRLYKTTIREAVAVKEIQFLQSDIFTEYPKAKVTEDYKQFIKEFLGE